MPLVVIQSRNPASPRTASIDQSSFGASELDDFADTLEGQVQRRLTKLLHELAGVLLVTRCRQLVVNGQAHVLSLPFIVQRPGQSVNRSAPGPDKAGVIKSG